MHIRPAIMILFGITGDLSKRKLLPALADVVSQHSLQRSLRIIGITRQADITVESLLTNVKDASFGECIEIFSLASSNTDVPAAEDVDGYHALAKRLTEIEKDFEEPAQRLFYLSVPPKTAQPVVDRLGASGLSKIPHTKLLMEKPFGSDTTSAKELIEDVARSFMNEQTYRIDHYLAKELVKKFIEDRRDDTIPRDTWNAKNIERIDIVAAESITIEGRGNFYEETGAVRDLIQSHLLQIAALTLMEVPEKDSSEDASTYAQRLADARYEALSHLRALPEASIRGQYDTYKEESGVQGSEIETFASIALASDDARWSGTTLTVTTGKALAKKQTHIKITYKETAGTVSHTHIISLAPEIGPEIPDAYYNVFLAALCDDREIFVSSKEIMECWRIVDAVRTFWKEHASPLLSYAKGVTVEELTSE